ncbi:MAG TPA: transglutaminase domain-containing protein, partial [Nevskia sp.]|nr:transglutaminase domain-containing protein [Nevskia sp.]
PRTLALARDWRDQGLDDVHVVGAALARFRKDNYYYTLHPPMLGRDSVDDFLFETKHGFCEHYASSFTVLMRAAGIPARVVTGYQGGEHNDVGDYYVIYQSDAHAWSEVWLEGQGWARVDPTAAVAPQRVEEGIREALAGTGELPSFLDPNSRGYNLRLMLTLRWDWMNEQWNHWVLGYGPQLQSDLMRQLGLMNWSDMIIALTAAVGVILGLLGAGLARQFLPRRTEDPALRLWQKALKRLRRAGLPARPDEGPRDYAARVAAQRPDLAEAVLRVSGSYLRQRYLAEPDDKEQRELAAAVAALRP